MFESLVPIKSCSRDDFVSIYATDYYYRGKTHPVSVLFR